MINFHTHSYYSYKKSILSIKDIVDFNKNNNENSFCITDINSLTSFVKAFALAKENNMKFIPGCEFFIKPNDEDDSLSINDKIKELNRLIRLKSTSKEDAQKYSNEIDLLNKDLDIKVENHSIIAIAKNNEGFNNLIRIFSDQNANSNSLFLSSNEDIYKNHEGIIIIITGFNSQFIYLIRHNRIYEAKNLLIKYKEVFKDDLYISIEHQSKNKNKKDFYDEIECYNILFNLANELNIKTIISNDVYYLNKSDKLKYRMFNNLMSGIDYLVFNEDNNYLMNENEIKNNFICYDNINIQDCLNNLKEIDDKCSMIDIPLSPELIDCKDQLIDMCKKGWEKKRKGTPEEEASKERLKYELSVVNGRNFSQYFIKVANIVNTAKELGILVGPGRGSACGCEIAYLLNIIEIDPLKYDLYFERFLNPERHGFPDIDIDMASIPSGSDEMVDKDDEDDDDEEDKENDISVSRNLLVDTLVRKGFFKFAGYIENEVGASTLVLFKNMAKYYDIPFFESNKISTSQIYSEKLKEKEYTGWLKEAVDSFGFEWEDVWDMLDDKMHICYELSGTPYNKSIAASGVIMSDTNAILPVRHENGGYHICLNGSDLESWNYIKFDLLTITTLNFIQYFRKLDVEWNDNSDPEVWEIFQNGDTDFVFQFSSPGMKRILTSVKPDSIETLAEINALYRPGPIGMGMIDKYIAVKTNNFTKETELDEEELVIKSILKDAFGEKHSGLVLFQEDVMKICQIGSGFSLSEADDIRKAMGKKKQALLDSYKKPFIERWKLHGDPSKIWDKMVDFGKYAFNKAHAVGYSIIAYQTALIWVKHRDKFLQYNLNFGNKKNYNNSIEKCKELNMQYKYPTIDNCSQKIKVIENNCVYMPGNLSKNYNSYVDLLFSENSDVYNAIYKGIFDSITKDRLALSELVYTCMKSAKEAALFMEPEGEKFTNLNQILNGLLACGGVESYNNQNDGIHVFMKRKRAKSNEIIFHNDPEYCKYYMYKYDKKMFGSIRNGVLSDLPFINTKAIEAKLENTKQKLIENGKEKQVYYKLKDILDEYMFTYFSSEKKNTFKNIYCILKDYNVYENSTKIIVEFNDKEDLFYINNRDKVNSKKVLSIPKNSLIKLDLIYSPFIKKRNNTFIYDFDILSIDEIKVE